MATDQWLQKEGRRADAQFNRVEQRVAHPGGAARALRDGARVWPLVLAAVPFNPEETRMTTAERLLRPQAAAHRPAHALGA